MKKIIKLSLLLVLLCAGLFAATAMYVDNLNADTYRPQLARFLADKTGRAVKLNGPIALSLTLHGVDVTVQDSALGNPAWASRPYMAGMGKFRLSLKLLPLLSHQMQIRSLAIENADILLETNAAGQHNWDFRSSAPAAPTPQATAQPQAGATVTQDSLTIDNLTVVNSQIAMRGPDGHVDSINVGNFALGMSDRKATVSFKGDDNGHPITLDLGTGITNLLNVGKFPFEGSASYDAIAVMAKGDLDPGARLAHLSSYQVSAAQTKLTGAATLAWSGARPFLSGTLDSARLDPADFSARDADADTVPGTAPTATTRKIRPAEKQDDGRLFTDTPLPLKGLRLADADMTITVGEMPVGKTALRQISARLKLTGGNLDLAPVKAMLGAAPLELQLKLNAAATPPHLTLGVIGSTIDLGELQKLANMTPFMSGQAGVNIQIAGDGDTPHEIASSLGGVITVSAEHGAVSGGAVSGVSQALAKIFNPQGGDAALNCLVTRFIAHGGVLTSNGILIDTAPSVVAGKGTVNLGSESVDLVLRAKTKLYDVGGLLPAVSVTGDLRHPAYNIDAQAVVQNVVGQLLAGKIDVTSSGVPAIAGAPAGQNACAYTLDHPVATASPGAGVLPADAAGRASQQIQSIGNSLIKGIFGK